MLKHGMTDLTIVFVYTMRPQMAREAPRACTGIGNPTVLSLSASPMAATRARASYGMKASTEPRGRHHVGPFAQPCPRYSEVGDVATKTARGAGSR